MPVSLEILATYCKVEQKFESSFKMQQHLKSLLKTLQDFELVNNSLHLLK